MRVCERVLDLRVMAVLAVAFAVSLGWASIAHAQAPFDVQYGSPTDSVGEISGIEGAEGVSEAGSAGLVGVSEARGEAAERPGAPAPQGDQAEIESSGVSAVQGVSAESAAAQGAAAQGAAPAEQGAVAAIGLLPDTGGPLLVFVAVVVAALCGLGLLAIRRIGRN